ncbi:MAG: DNA glycosylase [Oscillospiraceae bacterium]
MQIQQINCDIIITEIHHFDLSQTLDCGQCFRWIMQPTSTPDQLYFGIVDGKALTIRQSENKTLTLYNTSIQDLEEIWLEYFDLNRDYTYIKNLLSTHETLKVASDFAPGIRVLKQQPWETLCSFIMSQNNNIKRIKGIIAKLCECFGEEIAPGYYNFPSAQVISELSIEDLAPLKSGFRARYLLDAANKVASGEVDLQSLYTLPIADAEKQLTKIVGVGVKVAQCVLLYGFGRIECFPIDVWIKRAMATLFPEGLPEYALAYAGIAQQYIFHYARNSPELFE